MCLLPSKSVYTIHNKLHYTYIIIIINLWSDYRVCYATMEMQTNDYVYYLCFLWCSMFCVRSAIVLLMILQSSASQKLCWVYQILNVFSQKLNKNLFKM